MSIIILVEVHQALAIVRYQLDVVVMNRRFHY